MLKRNTQTRRAKEMFRVIEHFLSSNLSRTEFCKQQGIRYSTNQLWLSQYRQRNGLSKQNTKSPQKFIPIHLSFLILY